MTDPINQLFNSSKKEKMARRVLHKLRKKRALPRSPKTVKEIKQWFPQKDQSTVEHAAKKLGKNTRKVPVETSGKWKNGNNLTDGLYITHVGQAKELEEGPLDFDFL